MSAFLSVCYPDRIEILTDGAIYTENGTLIGVREKVYRLKSVPAAITTRGQMEALDAIGSHIDLTCQLLGSFDAGIAKLPQILKRLHEEGVTLEFEALIAGISKADGPVNLYFTTTSYIDEIDPFTVYKMAPHFGAGSDMSLDEWAAAGITAETIKDGLAEKALTIMEAMRQRKSKNPIHPDRPELFGIGGHIDLTTIKASGVTTKRLHVWPDRIGEKIDPAQSESPIVSMSRQQRRAASRQARKIKAA